ncbi:MAG: hypothetical protein GTN49_03175 [candidate division Zixibacteria bacterium]|nr:hypothetical protein [candidate division Zixibacteria bacterium]
MVAFKNVYAAFVKIAILISCGVLASAPAAAFSGMIPWRHRRDFGEVEEWYCRYTFDTYDEAVAAIEDWNDNYSEPYLVALGAWAAECFEVASDVERNVRYESLGKAVRISPDERLLSTGGVGTVWLERDRESARVVFAGQQGTTPWLEREVEVVERIVPAHEFPKFPAPGVPYNKARSAYCQIITDGLSKDEWAVLRFAIFDVKRFRRYGWTRSYFTEPEERFRKLVDEGYVTMAAHKENFWDRIRGVLPAKFDLEFTAAGKEYLHTLVDRCWNFRERMAAEARGLDKITAAEYKQLQKDNQCIREYFHEQIKRTAAWREYPGQYPYQLEKALKSFIVWEESLITRPCPYWRVVECVPKYIPAPKGPPLPRILRSGTYIYDARGVLRPVDLD